VHAWWDNGHFLVARIAYDKLKKENPAVIEKIDGILKPLKDAYPEKTNWEGDYPLVECATFADYKNSNRA